jgi:hypothetical protein
MSVPPHPPPIRYPRIGADDSIGLLREDAGGPIDHYLLLTADGSSRGRVDLRRGAILMWSSGDELFVVERDELDVPWLVKYRLQPD